MAQTGSCGLKYLFIGLTVLVILAFLIAFFVSNSFGYKYAKVCPGSGSGSSGNSGSISGS